MISYRRLATLFLLFTVIIAACSGCSQNIDKQHPAIEYDDPQGHLDTLATCALEAPVIYLTLDNNDRVMLPRRGLYDLAFQYNHEQDLLLTTSKTPFFRPLWAQMSKTPYGRDMAATLFVALQIFDYPVQALVICDYENQVLLLPSEAEVTLFPEFATFASSGIQSSITFYQNDGELMSHFENQGFECIALIATRRFMIPAIYSFWRQNSNAAVMMVIYGADGMFYKRRLLRNLTFPNERSPSIHVKETRVAKEDYDFEFHFQFSSELKSFSIRASRLFPHVDTTPLPHLPMAT